jgi:serine protease
MQISVINLTRELDEAEILQAIRAVNRQIAEDFAPRWHLSGRLRLDPALSTEAPDVDRPHQAMRGDAVLYLMDEATVERAAGYHTLHNDGVPFGLVFIDVARALGEPWSITLSHEALELLADSEVNLLCKGAHPDPAQNGRDVFHWIEVCDAVQAEHYLLDGVAVSNFVLPLYYTGSDEKGGRNDFLWMRHARGQLRSFGVNRGGYVGFYDPQLGRDTQYTLPADGLADRRAEIKAQRIPEGLRRRDRRQTPHPSEIGPHLGGVRARALRAAAPAPLPETGPVFEVLAFRVRPPRKGELTRSIAENAVLRTLGPAWRVEAARPAADAMDGLDFEASTGARLTPAEAWSASNVLASDRDVERTEPLFVAALVGAVEAEQARTAVRRSSAASEDLPGSAVWEWSLNQIGAPQAWDLVAHATGKPPGTGILVGHPDTGYREHDELRGKREGGYDFLKDDPEPIDADDAPSLRPFPGHGTGTASVIVSDRGPQHVDHVSGVAWGARFVPFRVSRSVIHLSMRNVTKAIHGAVDSGCRVISMSLGGIGWWFLHDAVRRAVDEGVIVIAAAGNGYPFVPFVVWPAAYDEVIAVAASNVERRPWSGSCRGSAVDITAPGESVWRADATAGSSTAVGRSSGTSYATAHVAGVAAMWLAYHGGWQSLADRYGKRGVPQVFKEILAGYGFSTVAGWDTSRFGPGILDAEAVLLAPLPAAAPARGMRAARATAIGGARQGDLISIAHLFPELSRAAARSGLIALLRVDDDRLDERLLEVGPELAFHLATDRVLARAFAEAGASEAREATPLTRERTAIARLAAPSSEAAAAARERLCAIGSARLAED